MKKFLQIVIAIKERASLSYTAAMFIYMVFLWVFKQEAAPLSMLFSLMIVCVAAGTMQLVAFSDLLFKKLAYGWRLVVFVIPFGAVLTAFAVGFGWFPTEDAGAWVEFGVIFIVIFLAITAGIEIYYRLSGRKYDDKLDWYRRSREK